jgi:OmpA-OmpF porin, OOP family
MNTPVISFFLKYWLLCLCAVFVQISTQAQIFKNLGKRVEQKAKDRAERKVDQAIDKGLDKAEGKVDDASKGGNKNNGGAEGNGDNNGGDNNNGGSGGNKPAKGKGGEISYKGKFDFVPGEKIVAFEDFAQDNIGDFPDRWNTNSTGELVNVDGKTGKWLMLNKEGVFTPEFITALPDNFTLELDVACNKEFSFYSSGFSIAMAALKNKKQFTNWKSYGPDREGTSVWVHPQDAGGSRGHSGFSQWNAGKEEMKNEAATNLFHGKSGKTSVHISIWRQKQRLRVYLDAEKVWDVPRAFEEGIKLNSIIFHTGGFHDESDRYFIGNIRLAVGAPDTRNKLITMGKFVTSGILFDVNSDKIKGESYGMIKEIANVLNENADVRVKIIGHTDSDGDDAANMELSKKRAAAIKNALTKDFGISASRMETDGKGESQPAVKNDTPENKAQNRRVEFVKL